MSTLWRRQEFLRICSKEDLVEKAQDIEVTNQPKKVKRHGTTSIQCFSSEILSQMGSQFWRPTTEGSRENIGHNVHA